VPELVKRAAKDEPDFLPNARRIASIAQAYRAKDIRGYDVRELTVLTDCIVLCTVSNEPQLKALYKGVRSEMAEIGVLPLHAEGEFSSSWLVLDFGTIMFHVFRENAYDFYDLDGLWGDAPEIDLDLDED
jgi:ribosome-associated protein